MDKPYLQMSLHINLEALVKICRMNAPKLEKEKIKIDMVDACVFTFIKNLCDSKHQKIESHRRSGYTWLSIKHMVEALPFLNMKYDTIQRRIAKLAKAQLIKKYTIQETGNKRKMYVMIPDYYKQMEAALHQKHQEYAHELLAKGENL